MLFLVLSLILMVGLLDRVTRRSRLHVLKAKTRYDLFALRDRLRREAIDGTIPYNNWFEYIDTTLTRSIENIENYTVWTAVFLKEVYKNNAEMNRALKEMESALQKPENEGLFLIYRAYTYVLMNFLAQRHKDMRFFANLYKHFKKEPSTHIKADTYKGIKIGANGNIVVAVKVLTTSPGTSTLLEHVKSKNLIPV